MQVKSEEQRVKSEEQRVKRRLRRAMKSAKLAKGIRVDVSGPPDVYFFFG